MVCSRCLVHHPNKLQVEISQLSCGISRRNVPFWTVPLGLGCACKIYFLYLYHVGRFNVDFKCLFTLDYIARLFGHQWMHSTVLLCVQYNVKLYRLFFKLSKEANVAAITITSQLHDTITKTNGNAMAVSQFELFSVLHIQTDIFCTLTYE